MRTTAGRRGEPGAGRRRLPVQRGPTGSAGVSYEEARAKPRTPPVQAGLGVRTVEAAIPVPASARDDPGTTRFQQPRPPSFCYFQVPGRHY